MKKLIITLVIVVGLLVGADFASAAAAEYAVSQQMRTQLHLATAPNVRINGFPFLYQAAVGDFRNVQIDANGLTVGQLSNVGIQAHLIDARTSVADVLGGNAKIDVDQLDGQVRLSAADVGRLLGISDLTITPAPKDALSGTGGNTDATDTQPGTTVDPTKTTVQLDGSVNIAGSDNKVRVIAVLSLLNGQMKIEPRKLELNNSAFGPIPLPPIFEQSVLQQFTTTLDPGSLPFKVTPTAVRTEPGVLVVEGTAHNVTISGDGVSSP
jgi:hypothetical protein